MKTAKLLGVVERQAGAQITRLLKAARQGYDRLTRSAAKLSDVRQQRRYVRAVRQTIASAEKIIAQLKTRVATVEKMLPAGKQRPRRGKRMAKRRAKRAVGGAAKRTRARRKKRG